MPSKPTRVGITGGIGSGKSVVARLFSILGVPIYNADLRARWLMENNQALIAQIKTHFGAATYQEGRINRDRLAKEVFGDESKLARLNELVHPAVGKDFENWISNHALHPYVIKEAALLIESGSYKKLDSLIVVCSPLHTRINRVLKRDPFRTREEVDQIIKNQIADDEREALADFKIMNNEEKSLIKQVLMLHAQLNSPGGNPDTR